MGTAERQSDQATSFPWKWIGVAAIIVALAAASRLLPVAQWLESFNEWVAGLGGLGIALFIGVYILATVLFAPGSVLTIGAGFAFGVGWGMLAVSIGSTVGAALAFLIARYVARDMVASKVQGNPKLRSIDWAIGERGAKLIFLLRLSPLIPFNLSNYFYGLTAVKFWPYVLASWLGMLPGTLLYVYLGAAGKAGLAAAGGEVGRSPLEWAFFGVGLIATVIVTVIITRVARKALSQSEVTAELGKAQNSNP